MLSAQGSRLASSMSASLARVALQSSPPAASALVISLSALLQRSSLAAPLGAEWQCGRGDRRTEKGKRKAQSNGESCARDGGTPLPPPPAHLSRRQVSAEERQ